MSSIRQTVLAAGIAASVLSAAPASAQVWATASSGSWFDPAGWTPMSVPNAEVDVADITVGGMLYTVSIDANNVILAALAVGADATVAVETRRLTIWGGSLTNNGTILVNATPGFSGSVLFRNTAAASLTGTGTVILNANANAFSATIGRGAFDSTVLTIGAGQTVTGRGIVSIPFINSGLISADGDNLTVSTGFGNATSSPGTLEALNAGQLDLRNINIDLMGTGVVNIDNAEARFIGQTFQQRLANGTVNTSNGGVIRSVVGNADLENMVLNGDALGDLRRGFRFFGSSFENNGTVTVTGDGVNAFNALQIHDTPYAFNGAGEMVLVHPPMTNPNASPGITDNTGGAVLTNAAGHTIRGKGRLIIETANPGTIIADAPGESFDLLRPVVNTGLLRATNGGTLRIGADVTQTGAGVIEVDNGFLDVIQTNPRAALTGGSVVASNGGKIRIESGDAFFSHVTLDTDTDLLGQSILADAGIVNNGSMHLRFDAGNFGILRLTSSQTWDGTGEIVLDADADNVLRYAQITRTSVGDTLTHGAAHTIRGTGEINAAIDNQGLISADVPGRTLVLQLEDKINSGTIRADDGTLFVSGVTVDQRDTGNGAGRLETLGNGEVVFGSAGSVRGGTIDGALSSAGPANLFEDVTNEGLLTVEGGAAILRGTTVNNGTIRVDQLIGAFPGFVEIDATVQLSGKGALWLNPITDSGGSQLRALAPGAALINDAAHTIRGAGQLVGLSVENRGLIAPGRTTPGSEIAEITYISTSNITCAPTSVIELEIAGPVIGEFDRIRSFGAATSTFHCAGTLELTNINGFAGLVPGDALEIINAPGGLSGTFDTVIYPNQINFGITYTPTSVRLVYFCVADVNQDEAVDILDVVDFTGIWNAQGPGADFNEDGAVNILDVLAFINVWNAGCQ